MTATPGTSADLEAILADAPALAVTSNVPQICQGTEPYLAWVVACRDRGELEEFRRHTYDEASEEARLLRREIPDAEVTVYGDINPDYNPDCTGPIPAGDPHALALGAWSWMPNQGRYCAPCAVTRWKRRE